MFSSGVNLISLENHLFFVAQTLFRLDFQNMEIPPSTSKRYTKTSRVMLLTGVGISLEIISCFSTGCDTGGSSLLMSLSSDVPQILQYSPYQYAQVLGHKRNLHDVDDQDFADSLPVASPDFESGLPALPKICACRPFHIYWMDLTRW